MTTTPADRAMLARALAVARTSAGRTAPNPNVGCVIAHGERILGEGASRPAGEAHAEVVALAAAGDDAQGATAYVTLEPCAHAGRTPACTDALVDAGIARVVFAHDDPHPVARGGGQRLREKGVGVVGPLPSGDPFREAVAEQLEGFLTVVRLQRPHVTLKLAQTSDGRLTVPSRRYLTGTAARRAVHRWRSEVDAVLVGSGTVLTDDPRLDVRDVPITRSPRPIVIDRRLRIPPSAHVVARGALVMTRSGAPVERRKALIDAGAEVVDLPELPDATAQLRVALELSAEHGILSILAEPGATLATALVDANLVDRLVLHVALDAGDGRPRRAVGSPAQGHWRTRRSGGAGPDLILHLVPDTAPPPAAIGGS